MSWKIVIVALTGLFATQHAAHGLNGPTFAHAILTTSELLAALSSAGR